MKFKYFEKPEIFVGFRETETTCDICRQTKLCFDAELFYGSHDLTSICPDCLSSGLLVNKDAFTCSGDIQNLKKQLKHQNANFTDNQIQEIANTKTVELEKTTPHLITWQDWSWPCADGDYCRFIGYGSKPLYREFAKDKPVEEFFKATFYDTTLYNDELWTESVPDKAIKNYSDSNEHGTLFYVFKSLNSDKIITVWDCN